MKSPSPSKITLALAFLAIAASASAQAQNRAVQYDTVARLIETRPVYAMKAGGSHQECTESAGQRSQERSNSGAVIGAIAGGLAGKSIGKGNGNTLATATGSAIGAIAGDRIQNDTNGYSVQKQCYLVQDPPVEVQSGFTSILEVNDEAGNHRVTVQTQSPLRADANGLVRIRVGIAMNQY